MTVPASNSPDAGSKVAVVLCGGRGSRMGAITNSIPKALIEVHGKPILWYSFWTLYGHGFRDFILPLGYLGHMIRDYMMAIAGNLDCRIVCVETGDDTPIAGRIEMIRDQIMDGADFFLINSDTIFEFDVESMLALHRRTKALVTLSSVDFISTWGLIIQDGERIAGFDRERKVRHLMCDDLPGMHGLVNSGLAWLNKDALDQVDLRSCSDFETAVYKRAIDLGRVSHYHIEGEWFPIDTPKELHILNLQQSDLHDSGMHAKAVHDRLASMEPSRSTPSREKP